MILTRIAQWFKGISFPGFLCLCTGLSLLRWTILRPNTFFLPHFLIQILGMTSFEAPDPISPGAQEIYSAEKVQKVWWCDCVNILLRLRKIRCCRVPAWTFKWGAGKLGGSKTRLFSRKGTRTKLIAIYS